MHTIKKKLGFKTIHSDAGVYVLNHQHKGGNTEMILILYVDVSGNPHWALGYILYHFNIDRVSRSI